MAAALAGSASAARDATVNEYGLPYPAPVTIAVAPSSVWPSSVNAARRERGRDGAGRRDPGGARDLRRGKTRVKRPAWQLRGGMAAR